ncbi:LysR family transcriptional regulator ArgP [Microbacterium esteraromaticum]|uniref:LysR family transcriptional regulator ArgP n=1 Tax=Microbacterium esteraromaticum TaxID=57043 RepID=UPI0019D3E82E|nr:LysR family transcriptional regulator ArgP [Microbacterium esteraromaticum]MBN7794593.1 LysR family transcriptional regulator ArgP [Microbacterium esteraromaticum]MBN8425464.1 LysR family transcriptional regulator ArgP [Microbacterium esteraromaticum]
MKIDAQLAATIAAVIDEGSFEAAARRLHITQSAVSQRVRVVEQQIGRAALVRSRPVRATEAGEALVRLARQVELLEHDVMVAFGLGDAEPEAAVETAARVRIPLAVNADSMATWFLSPIARIARQHPIDVDLHRDDQDYTARMLESGEVMAAVTSEAEPVGGSAVTPLGVLEYRAMATTDYFERWFADGVSNDALRKAPFVDFDRRDALQQGWLRARGVDPWSVPRHYVPASHDFSHAVRLGLGWGLIPMPQATEDLIELGEPRIRVPLYWQQWNLRSPLLDAIAAEVAAEASRVLVPLR